MKTQTSVLHNCISFLKKMIQKGGPEPQDYRLFDNMLEELATAVESKEVSKNDLQEIYNLFDDDFMQKTAHGHSFRKPFGYAGDFMIIDRVYQIDIHPEYKNWDKYILNHRTCEGIRNRKEYFKNTLKKICLDNKSSKIELLNVASGPARDLQELYASSPIATKNLNTLCIDHDPKAIDFATQLTSEFKSQISFERANIYKYETLEKYDVVWSSGLFDYFDDTAFVQILNKLINWGKPNSEIIIGNICSAHSLKNYMELLWEWPLHIRSSKDLIKLAIEAGAEPKNVKIGIEGAGIFLFLHIHK